MQHSFNQYFEHKFQNRIIFEKVDDPVPSTPENPEKPKEEPTKPASTAEKSGEVAEPLTTTPPSTEQASEEVAETTIQTPKEDPEKKAEAERLTKLLYENAESFAKNIDKLPKEEVEKLQKLAEQQTQLALKGWEWMGLSEKEADKKYLKLAQAYLEKSTDEHGQEIYIVKKELDYSENTKFGIGAGDLLPPSVTEVEITDLSGQTQRGTRKVSSGNKIGYYDSAGNYIRIFGGYKIRPLNFVNEKSKEYEKSIEQEKEHYLEYKALEKSSEDILAGNSRADITGTPGLYNSPVTSLASLEKSTKEDLKKKEASPMEIERIFRAKSDLRRIKAICKTNGIGIGALSEPSGGHYLVQLDGKGSKYLGWTDSQTSKETEYLKKLTDKKQTEEILKTLQDKEQKTIETGIKIVKDSTKPNGHFFVNDAGREIMPEDWATEKASKEMQQTPTLRLIKAMQSGGQFMEYSFIGNYEFDITDLENFHNLITNDRDRLHKALKESISSTGKVNPRDFIKKLDHTEIADAGLGVAEFEAMAKKNPNLDWFINKNWKCKCPGHSKAHGRSHTNFYDLLASAKKLPSRYRVDSVNYQWNVHKEKQVVGKLQCARTVSDILGLNGKLVSVTRTLAPALIEANLRKSGGKSTGIILGMENFREGDVIIWRGGRKGPDSYGHNRFGHTGIVRHIMEINGEKYIAMQHNSDKLLIELVPVNRNSMSIRAVQKAIDSRNISELLQRQPAGNRDKLTRQFQDIFSYRPQKGFVRIRKHGDASKMPDATFAFAIRTSTLQRTA